MNKKAYINCANARPSHLFHESKSVCAVYDTTIGRIMIESNMEAVTAVSLAAEESQVQSHRTELTDMAAKQLNEYLAGKRRYFDIPLLPHGTQFQQLVWKALQSIPYGQTRSYKQIAELIGNPQACRAVGMANNKNPILILIPCHRVIGSDGSLVGYGAGLPLKKRLLALEKGCIL